MAENSTNMPDQTATILAVDDQEIVLETLAEILTQLGYRTDTTTSGPQALAKIAAAPYDLVICDIKMPQMSGLQLLEEIKRTSSQTPVIVITGFPSISIAIEAMKKGASDFITKPFDVDLVEHLVQRTLRESRLIKRNQALLAEVNQKAVIEELNRQLNSKIDQLTKMMMITERISRLTDNEAVFTEAVRLGAELTGAEKVSLMIYDRNVEHLAIRAAIGLPAEVIRDTRVELGEGIVGRVARSRQPVRKRSLDSAPRGADRAGSRYFTSSFLSTPLMIGDELFGVLNVTDKRDRGDFDEGDWLLVEQLAEKLAIRIENNVLYEGIYANLIDTLRTLVSTLEARDSYTRRHSQQVTSYAIAVARELGRSDEDAEVLKFAGILHDIGKIGISDVILLKPGRLTAEEFASIKQHPVIGDNILDPLGLSAAERQIIRHHHERIDGSGYPDGLQGDKIPMTVRIISVADAFDAMTTNRPYRQAMAVEDAFAEMRRCGGTQLDATVVEALIDCVEEGRVMISNPEIVAPGDLDLNILRASG
ncbi:HD domain-containing phosphohydrolase [Candidatus Sumerlaeota bacterium]